MDFTNYLNQSNDLVEEKGHVFAAHYFATKLAIVADELRRLEMPESSKMRIQETLTIRR